jgi:hypothetical protein
MKKVLTVLIVILILFVLVMPALAGGHGKKIVINKTNVTEADKNTMDFGEYLNIVLGETKNVELGLLTTYLNESSEFRAYIGAKIYLNRMTYQKE